MKKFLLLGSLAFLVSPALGITLSNFPTMSADFSDPDGNKAMAECQRWLDDETEKLESKGFTIFKKAGCKKIDGTGILVPKTPSAPPYPLGTTVYIARAEIIFLR